MFPLFKFKDDINVEGFALILPTVSVGNVPQLAIDLIVNSYGFEKVATVWDPAIVAAVGPDPFEKDGLNICTACELFINKDLKLAVLQLRSTLESKLVISFLTKLRKSLAELKFGKIIILTSSFDHELHNISPNKFFYISNHDVSETMKKINVKPKELEFNDKYVIHGSGFAVKLFEFLKENFDTLLLIKYVSEGDNRPDAISTIEILSKFVDKFPVFNIKTIKSPYSWNFVFGGSPPLGLF